MEQLDFRLPFHSFVGLEMDDPTWDVTVLSRGRERLIWRAVSQWLPEQAQVDRASPRLKQTGSLSAPGKNARLGRRGFDRTADRCGVSLDAEAEADSDCIAGLIRPKCALSPAERPPGANENEYRGPNRSNWPKNFGRVNNAPRIRCLSADCIAVQWQSYGAARRRASRLSCPPTERDSTGKYY